MNDSIFNETEYLAANPDVASAVKEGGFRSGQEHYKKYGKSEGRMLKRLFGITSREEKVFHLLVKPTSVLSLVIPDKRYCFDYFSSSSSTGNVLDAYAEKRVRPSHGQVFDHIPNASKRNGNIAWSSDGMGGASELVHTFAEAQAHWALSVATTDYIDVHCWRFTPASFRLLVADLLSLGLVNLEIKTEFDTTGCEFYVSLGKKSDAPMKLDRLTALQTRKLENA